AADLDHVAQTLDAGRFADEAQVGHFAALADQLDQRAGAVDRRAFLVAGYDHAERAGLARNLRRRRDHRRHRALHVDRAAPVEQVAAHLGREGAAGPALARRDHVEMPGEGEMARALGSAADGEAVLDRAALAFVAPDEAVALEPERRE